MQLFQYRGSICVVPRRHPGNSKFSTRPPRPLAAIVSEFNRDSDQGLVTKAAFRLFTHTNGLPNGELAKLVGLPQGMSILQWTSMGDLHSNELKPCHVELTSCGADG